MSRSLRHGALAATAIAFSIVSLSACAAGNNAETLKVRPDNAATSVGSIKVQNANVITQAEAEAEGPAAVTATLFNDGTEAEVLESITLPGTDVRATLRPAKGKGPVEILAGGRVILGGKGNASAVIDEGREATQDGNVQQVVFKLQPHRRRRPRRERRPGDRLLRGLRPQRAARGPGAEAERDALRQRLRDPVHRRLRDAGHAVRRETPGAPESPAAGTEQQGGTAGSQETPAG
ncbi:Lipoprotein OS=Streptomyces microflavus OX=1919 GN=Smic_44130 PE=4 SV=1 [Streptomyces microflavus]